MPIAYRQRRPVSTVQFTPAPPRPARGNRSRRKTRAAAGFPATRTGTPGSGRGSARSGRRSGRRRRATPPVRVGARRECRSTAAVLDRSTADELPTRITSRPAAAGPRMSEPAGRLAAAVPGFQGTHGAGGRLVSPVIVVRPRYEADQEDAVVRSLLDGGQPSVRQSAAGHVAMQQLGVGHGRNRGGRGGGCSRALSTPSVWRCGLSSPAPSLVAARASVGVARQPAATPLALYASARAAASLSARAARALTSASVRFASTSGSVIGFRVRRGGAADPAGIGRLLD